MPGAVIAFDQARPGPTVSYGSPGVARKDLWLGQAVTCRSTAPSNISYAWSFLDVPAGSAAALTNADQVNAIFTPDVAGSYRVQLVTNGGGPGNVQILIAAVSFDAAGVLTHRGWRIPAYGEVAGEDNWGGNQRGWAEALEFMLNEIRVSLDASLQLGGTIFLASTLFAAGSATFVRAGARFVDMSAYPATIGPKTRTVTFVADVDMTGGAASVEVRLFDATHAVPITGADLTSSSVANAEVTSAGLTVGSAAGNVRDDVVANYEVQLRMNGGALGTDQVFLTNARLVITYS